MRSLHRGVGCKVGSGTTQAGIDAELTGWGPFPTVYLKSQSQRAAQSHHPAAQRDDQRPGLQLCWHSAVQRFAYRHRGHAPNSGGLVFPRNKRNGWSIAAMHSRCATALMGQSAWRTTIRQPQQPDHLLSRKPFFDTSGLKNLMASLSRAIFPSTHRPHHDDTTTNRGNRAARFFESQGWQMLDIALRTGYLSSTIQHPGPIGVPDGSHRARLRKAVQRVFDKLAEITNTPIPPSSPRPARTR